MPSTMSRRLLEREALFYLVDLSQVNLLTVVNPLSKTAVGIGGLQHADLRGDGVYLQRLASGHFVGYYTFSLNAEEVRFRRFFPRVFRFPLFNLWQYQQHQCQRAGVLSSLALYSSGPSVAGDAFWFCCQSRQDGGDGAGARAYCRVALSAAPRAPQAAAAALLAQRGALARHSLFRRSLSGRTSGFLKKKGGWFYI